MGGQTLVSISALGPRPEWVTASSSAWAYTLVVGAAFLISVIWCIVYVVRQRDALPLVMLAGGVISMGLEPAVDTLGKVWYAKDNPWVVYVGMGVPQPAFLLMGYSLFWGGAVYIASRLLRNGLSGRRLGFLALPSSPPNCGPSCRPVLIPPTSRTTTSSVRSAD